MTVAILKEFLTELNITYKSSDRKAALILKVKEARCQMNQHGCNSEKQHHGHHTRNAKRNSGQCHFVLYFDQYAHKRMLILILIMFLLSLYGHTLPAYLVIYIYLSMAHLFFYFANGMLVDFFTTLFIVLYRIL